MGIHITLLVMLQDLLLYNYVIVSVTQFYTSLMILYSKILLAQYCLAYYLTFFLDFQIKFEKLCPVEGGARISEVRIR